MGYVESTGRLIDRKFLNLEACYLPAQTMKVQLQAGLPLACIQPGQYQKKWSRAGYFNWKIKVQCHNSYYILVGYNVW